MMTDAPLTLPSLQDLDPDYVHTMMDHDGSGGWHWRYRGGEWIARRVEFKLDPETGELRESYTDDARLWNLQGEDVTEKHGKHAMRYFPQEEA